MIDAAALSQRPHLDLSDLLALAEGRLLADPRAPRLPRGPLLPFHGVPLLAWDPERERGRIEARRRVHLNDWFFDCHFRADPVMPGCLGVDALWQCLRVFGAWRGLPGPLRPVALADCGFFGQIRPHDREVTYRVEDVEVEPCGGGWALTGRGEVAVDDEPIYRCAELSVAAEPAGEGASAPALPHAPAPVDLERELPAPLTLGELHARDHFTRAELVAAGRGTLTATWPEDMARLPTGLMLNLASIAHLSFDERAGRGWIEAKLDNDPCSWSVSLDAGEQPTMLLLDAIWQLLGFFLTWLGARGSGRALGCEELLVHAPCPPTAAPLRCRIEVLRVHRAANDSFVLGDAWVLPPAGAGERPLLSVLKAKVGCHPGIAYPTHPRSDSPQRRGGRLAGRVDR
ncbi:MAG: hypothetical protein AB7N76_24210 [Planctomycetota bacterium]